MDNSEDRKVIDFKTRRPRVTGPSLGENPETKSGIIKVDPEKDIVVGLAMKLVEIMFEGPTDNPLAILTALFVATDGVKSAFVKQYGQEEAGRIAGLAFGMSKNFLPMLKCNEKAPKPDDPNGAG